jgi:hypothetical protein
MSLSVSYDTGHGKGRVRVKLEWYPEAGVNGNDRLAYVSHEAGNIDRHYVGAVNPGTFFEKALAEVVAEAYRIGYLRGKDPESPEF